MNQVLSDRGFSKSDRTSNEEWESFANYYIETYKGYEILFYIANGGICAAILISVDGEKVYKFPVGSTDKNYEFHFDHLDTDGVLNHCKQTIDLITA